MTEKKPEKQEMLEGIFDGRRTHAKYPTALATLCLREPHKQWVSSQSVPSCPECRKRAMLAAFRSSAPRRWWEAQIERGLRAHH